MNIKEFSWQTIDDLEIYGKYWTSDKNLKAVICAVHGMGEHINRYDSLAQQLNQYGIAFIGFDQRGHGNSEGQRGHTPNYELLLHSIDDLLSKAEEFFPETPKILFGHSMGGNLVLNFAIERNPNLKGLIVSSPLLQLAFTPPTWKIKLGSWIKNIFPSLPQKSGLDATAISTLKDEVEKYKNDKKIHDYITPSMYFSIIEKGEYALNNASQIQLPTLLYHGNSDQITSFEASKNFAEKMNSDLITFQTFENGYHETHNDFNRKKLLSLISNWVDKQLASKAKRQEKISE